jgi:threonine aldolase
VCGRREFIREARRGRKVVGGGMRQAGVLAAAGIVALEQMVDRLAEDHANARSLAAGLAELPGIQVEDVAVRTDIVFFNVVRSDLDGPQLTARMAERGVRMLPLGPRRIRAVTNYHVTAEDIQAALQIIRGVLGAD